MVLKVWTLGRRCVTDSLRSEKENFVIYLPVELLKNRSDVIYRGRVLNHLKLVKI